MSYFSLAAPQNSLKGKEALRHPLLSEHDYKGTQANHIGLPNSLITSFQNRATSKTSSPHPLNVKPSKQSKKNSSKSAGDVPHPFHLPLHCPQG